MLVTVANRPFILVALYNRSKPQGMGFLNYRVGDLDVVEAEKLCEAYSYFDYLYGRVLKVNLKPGALLDLRLYDRDNGDGAGEAALKAQGVWE